MPPHYALSNDWPTLVTVIAIMLMTCVAIYTVATRTWKLSDRALWYWLGSLTYPLYLLHAMAGKALYGMMPTDWSVWPRIALSLAAVFAVVTPLAIGIEQHGCQALYRWLSGERRERPASRPTTSTV